jgi:archaellum component FlaC
MKNNKHVESFGKFNENLNISDVMNSILNELEQLKSKYKGLSKSAVSEFEDNVSHFKYVGRTRGINDAIELVKKYCS